MLEKARTDARAHVLRATVLPSALGTVLFVPAILLSVRALRPGASLWVRPAASLAGLLGVTGALLGATPTVEGMTQLLCYEAIAFNVAMTAAATRAYWVGLADASPACATVASLLESAVPAALLIPPSIATGLLYAVGLASWRAHARGAAPTSALCGVRPLTTRRLSDSGWLLCSNALVGYGLIPLYTAAVRAALGEPGVGPDLACVAIFGVFLALWRSRAVRARVDAFLVSGGETVATAAGIASLLGGAVDATRVQTSIGDARERMRAIPFSALDESAMERETPTGRHSNYWYERSSPCSVDQCDAFVSHSWWDPAAHKWAALQAWAAHFESEHGRTPIVWLDRACIEQTNVQADLQYLPIYLAACKQLVILAGPSYLSRMWCIVELFIFDQMWPATEREGARSTSLARAFSTRSVGSRSVGGTVVMTLLPGLDAGAFDSFDAAQARCSVQDDYERLLRCVEIGCGSVQSFNARARLLLKGVDQLEWEAPALAQLALALEPSAPPPPRTTMQRRASAGGPGGDGGARAPGRSHAADMTRLWLRAYAVCLALLAVVGAPALRPAFADCARCAAADEAPRAAAARPSSGRQSLAEPGRGGGGLVACVLSTLSTHAAQQQASTYADVFDPAAGAL